VGSHTKADTPHSSSFWEYYFVGFPPNRVADFDLSRLSIGCSR
jgi:hypothetical protein